MNRKLFLIVQTSTNSYSIPTDRYIPKHDVAATSSVYFIIRHSLNPASRAFEFMHGTSGFTTMAKPADVAKSFWCSVVAFTSSTSLLFQLPTLITEIDTSKSLIFDLSPSFTAMIPSVLCIRTGRMMHACL